MRNIFKNPYVNSLTAEVYIIILVTLMHLFTKPNTPDTGFEPVVALSLFVLSASVMGFLFLGEPLQLFLNGEKKEAVSFFARTVLSFAIFTLIAIVILTVLQ